MGNKNGQVFYGREDTLDLIRAHQQNPEAKKPLVLYGEGGCGKTSMLSKAASMSPKWFPGSRPICFIRFLGTTPDSSSLQPTLVSLCQQVCFYLIINKVINYDSENKNCMEGKKLLSVILNPKVLTRQAVFLYIKK